jgi:hypothetical protein
MLTVYRQLLRLYPVTYRAQFADEMLAVFLDASADIRKQNALRRVMFSGREILGLVSGIWGEHLHLMFGHESGFSVPKRSFVMRNGFRFPKATAILMTIILAGVIVAIHQGEVIATSLPSFSQPITPIHPAHSYLLPGVIEGIIFFYGAGLAGWAIMFALRRSGVHRLDEMSGDPK